MRFGRWRSPPPFDPATHGSPLALGWCFKRTNRLAQAIDSLERALREHPDEALLHYNLACYWSLAANGSKALDELSTALDLDPNLRTLITNESDFDGLRGNPRVRTPRVRGAHHRLSPPGFGRQGRVFTASSETSVHRHFPARQTVFADRSL